MKYRYGLVRLGTLFLFFVQICMGALPCAEGLRNIVVVGPYSSGKGLVHCAGRQGLGTLGVLADPTPCSFDGPSTELDHQLVYRGDVGQLADAVLRTVEGPVASIFAGSEWDPRLADALRAELRRRGNPTLGNRHETAEIRRDKIEFYRALADHDIPVPRHKSSDRLDTLLKWYEELGEKEIVIKAPRGSGTRGVFFCHSEAEIKAAFHKIYTGRPNANLDIDYQVIAQEKLRGTEYGINGVVVGGMAFLTGLWKYQRREEAGAATVYVADRLQQVSPEVHRKLLRFLPAILKATGTEYGAFHLEMIDDPEKGTFPVDFAARGSGGGLLDLEEQATDRNPFDLILRSQLDPVSFRELAPLYRRTRHAAVAFISTAGGRTASRRLEPTLREMQARGEIFNFSLRYPEGQPMERTVGADTIVAEIGILAPSDEVLESRLSFFFELQAQHAFEN